ncbi:VOC family protein [Hymenobacter negativus]|uniref:VOC family protein n=1 Tax=Hymenobacter negativus TaxID=2795026 RepID=A0ABS3QNV0_9BACT|nr:VOC family protein [Hymenobacter negativus]MBO2012965.1 VOC family protein [Hymenobacter negativus]
MNIPFKPAGYTSVSPYFVVEGAQQLADLLRELFGAVELRRFAGPNGTVGHLELQLDDSVLMLADAMPTYPANRLLLHVYVPDVHATYARALALGCEAVEAPVNKPGDPDIRGTSRDFAGNTWAIGMQAAAVHN